jgi:serine protease Do
MKSTIQSNPKNKNTNNLRQFGRLIVIIIVLSMFTLIGVFLYIIVNSNSNFSKWAVKNSPLNNYLSLDSNQASKNSISIDNKSVEKTTNTTKPVNDILGLTNNNDNGVSFSNPTGNLTVSQTVDKVLPSVVSIQVTIPTQDIFSKSGNGGGTAAGTGYFVSKDGLIITNKHVISFACNTRNNSTAKISGLTHDQKAYELELLTVDPIEDIAILKVKNTDLSAVFPAVEISDSSKIKLGSEVLAVGNTLGELQNTVTRGIVSGLDRSLNTNGEVLKDSCTGRSITPESLIQTDAAINQGNSGGPLFNSNGQLIAMNTYGIPDAQNIGLAIPSARIKSALESYLKNQKIIRPRIGIVSKSLTPIDKQSYNWLPTDFGEIIYSGKPNISAIIPDSAAAKAGLKDGDIVLSINGNELRATSQNPSPLLTTILSLNAGDNIELSVLKATKQNGNGYEYEKTPQAIKVELGGTSYDIKSNQLN